MLQSGRDINADPKLSELFHRVVDTTYTYELQAFRAGDGFQEAPAVPAPIDEVADMTFPVDPRLKDRAELAAKNSSHDLPLTVNDEVLSFLNAEPVVMAMPLSEASPVVTFSVPVSEAALISPTRPVTVSAAEPESVSTAFCASAVASTVSVTPLEFCDASCIVSCAHIHEANTGCSRAQRNSARPC